MEKIFIIMQEKCEMGSIKRRGIDDKGIRLNLNVPKRGW